MSRGIKLLTLVLLLSAGLHLDASFGQMRTQVAAGEAVLAERFAELARETMQVKAITPHTWQRSAALLQAAVELNPTEPRYARLLAEAMLQMEDIDGAIEAVRTVLRIDPADRVAQIRMIDLHLVRMQTADARISYLRDLLGRVTIPEEVRSHVAARCARLAAERGQDQQAKALLSQSLRLNPLNLEALRLQYEMLSRSGTALERSKVLLAKLRANPAQPRVMTTLAAELADAGLVEPSLHWYVRGLEMTQRMALAPELGPVRAYAAQLFIAGHRQAAGQILRQLLEVDPEDVEAWFVGLIIERAGGDADTYAAARRQVREVLFSRLAAIRDEAGLGPAGAANTLPDLSGDPAVIQEQRPDLLEPYVFAAGDLAWFEIYFNEQPAAARPVIEALQAMLGEESATVARLAGWSYLVEGRRDEAQVKLSAVAERDPLAAMGMIRLAHEDEQTRDAARSQARALISENPSRLLGAMLAEGLRIEGAQIVPGVVGEAIAEELEQFPEEWLRVLDRPQNFYSVRGQPLRVSHGFGEPMLVRITLTNLSDFDLTIGEDGVIRPDLWFDAQLRGLVQEAIPGVAYDRLWQRTVLRGRQSFSQVVRLDQGALAQFFNQNPMTSLQVFATVLINPVAMQDRLGPGPAGYRVQTGILERTGFAMRTEEIKEQVYETITAGEPDEKIRKLQLLATYSAMFRSEQADEQLRRLALEFRNVVRRSMNDSDAAVAAWASYLSALLAGPEQRPELIRAMAEDPGWYKRLLALIVMVQSRAVEQEMDLVARMAEEDAQPLIRAYAAALRDAPPPAPAEAQADQ